MFCPKCAARNEIEQSYCRQCGQPLETVALVLKGSFDEVMTKYDSGYDWLISGLVTFGIFLLIATLVFIFGNAWNAAVNIALGLIISLPMIIKGIWQVESASKLLEAEKESKEFSSTKQPDALPSASFNTDSIIPPSVTERTTRKLAHSKRRQK